MPSHAQDSAVDTASAGCPMSSTVPTPSPSVDLEKSLATPFPWARGPIDPPAEYAVLREKQPVVRVKLHDGQPVWLVTRYDDVRAILSDPRVSADETKPGFPTLGPHVGTFNHIDDPKHAHLRGLISKNFLLKRVKAMRPEIQELVDDAIDAMVASGERQADLVPALAMRVPATVLGNLLGVPLEDRDHFIEQIAAMVANADPSNIAAQERTRQIAMEIYAYIGDLLDRELARETPSDDIIGQLVAAHRRDEISRADSISTGFLIIGAGFDTTANAASLGVLTLLTHPDEFDKLREDPSLLDNAIEELLRWLTHVHLIVQAVALEDIEIGGVTIPAGEGILPLNFSANRDESHYEDPDAFKIDRRARDHVAFSYGIHQCLGQSLARLELNVIFETLFRRLPDLRLAVDPTELDYKLTARIHGVAALPVAW